MKNYVVINGINSNTINGLGINELPPITKPQMRVLQEEIDGRDGDITTNLGYSAYDKTITIGLFGTGYDIDDIIAFFNGEGTIVFSNEPDKYYNFKIINQIDYVALQKFKTASITFHCQPFKYPLEETPLEIEYDYVEEEGTNITLNNTAESVMKITLTPTQMSQEGTPTPSTPQTIHTISGDNEIVVCGRNLWDEEWEQGFIQFNKDASNWGQNLASTTQIRSKNYIQVDNTKTYYGYIGNSTMLAIVYDKDYQPIVIDNAGYINITNQTFTLPSNAKYIRFYTIASYGGTYNNDICINVSDANINGTYYPYQSQSKPLNLGELEYNAIGDYKDEFVKIDGKWYLRKNIPQYIFTGNETPNSITGGYFYYNSVLGGMSYVIGGFNTKFQFVNDDRITGNDPAMYYLSDNQMAFRVGSTKDRLYIKTQLSESDLKSTLANTPLYYVTTTPQDILLNDTLQNQIEDIYNATMSYEGQTNISQVNNDLAFIINSSALEKGSNEIVVNNIGNVYSKPLIALEGSGNVDIYLNNTQILQANVEDKMNIDIAKLEAYNPDTSALLNRQVIGNYNSMTLQPGNNTIRIDGALDKATISNYTRWL